MAFVLSWASITALSFSSSWTLPSFFPNAPFIMRLMDFSRLPSFIRLAIRLALSSNVPFPCIITSTCSFGKSLIRLTASLSNAVSTFPRAFLRLLAISYTVFTLFTPFNATSFIAEPSWTACSRVMFRPFASPSSWKLPPPNVFNDCDATVMLFDISACFITKSDDDFIKSPNFFARYTTAAA